MTAPTTTSIRTAPQGQDSRDTADAVTATRPLETSLDMAALLKFSDDDLHDLFCDGPSDWARQLNQLEGSLSTRVDQLPRVQHHGLARVRDALRAAMWTHHRWITWKVE